MLISHQSKNFDSAHEILGFIMIILILAQLGLGIYHHRKREVERKELAPSPPPPGRRLKYTSPGFIHSMLGIFIFLFGIVECAIGFNFALAVTYNKLWVPLVLAAVILVLFVYGIRYCFDTSRKDRQEFEEINRRNAEARLQTYGQPQAHGQPQTFGQPQPYGAFGAYKQPDVEMRAMGGAGQEYGQVNVPRPY